MIFLIAFGLIASPLILGTTSFSKHWYKRKAEREAKQQRRHPPKTPAETFTTLIKVSTKTRHHTHSWFQRKAAHLVRRKCSHRTLSHTLQSEGTDQSFYTAEDTSRNSPTASYIYHITEEGPAGDLGSVEGPEIIDGSERVKAKEDKGGVDKSVV